MAVWITCSNIGGRCIQKTHIGLYEPCIASVIKTEVWNEGLSRQLYGDREHCYSDEWLDFVTLNRINKSERQAHDYDIIEGPVADDDIATRVYEYLKGKVSKKQFLSELTLKRPTHQICFCTIQSLQSLEVVKDNFDAEITRIDNELVKALMTDFGFSELEATKMYCKSQTYNRLTDVATEFYLKPWYEIYQILLNE